MANAATLPTLPPDVRLMNGLANALFALAGVALAVAAVWWVVRLPVFAFRVVRLEGEIERNSVSTIRANAMPHLKGNFFTMDLDKARAAFEGVPWVRRAVVHRVWPNVLRVQLQEHHPVALWEDASGNEELVNAHGEVFEANVGDVEDMALPTFAGPDGSSAHMLAMFGQLQPVFAKLDTAIDAVSLSGRGSWRVTLDSDAEVELGRGDDAEVLARTERFVRTLPQVTGRFQRPLAYADLRHMDGYAVKLKGVTTLPADGDGAKAGKH